MTILEKLRRCIDRGKHGSRVHLINGEERCYHCGIRMDYEPRSA